jgi:RNA polymerase primary sigma factor
MEFGIRVEDGSETISTFASDQNLKRLELYDWQKRAINYFFSHNGQAVFEITTGGGKTICAIEIIKLLLKEHPDLQILIVVPKNVILEKTWFKELYDAGFNLRDIGVFYGVAKEYAKITITNMQNIHKIAMDIFDFAIWDEVHNYGTVRLLKYLVFPFKYKLGLSATVTRVDNMHYDILEKFNYNIFKYSPKQALEEGVLNPFDFINIGVILDDETQNKYNILTQELNLIFQIGGGFTKIMHSKNPIKFRMLSKLNERKQLVNNYPRKFDIVKMICLKHRHDKVLVFNQFNEQTNKCYWHLLDVGVKSRIVHSGIDVKERDKNLSDFAHDKINVLLTSKVLDEGYNLPKIDTAVIMAGDSTSKQTIQRMGRVLRKKDKESTLYQIYCKNTIEEEYGNQRAILFKQLCNRYRDSIYDGKWVGL